MATSRPTNHFTTVRLISLLAPPLLVMAGIFYLSSQTSTGDHSTLELIVRKLGHVTEYAILTACWIRAMVGLGVGSNRRNAVVAAVAVTLAYAATDELHQTFVTGRHGTPVDVLIDSIGVAIAALLAMRGAPVIRSKGDRAREQAGLSRGLP